MYGLNFVNCHRKPERSFFYKGKQFPVCARCTGILVGYSTMLFFIFNIFQLNIGWTIGLVIPTYLDGITQAYFGRESNNTLRFITGLLAGIGLSSFCSLTGKLIGAQLLMLIS